jgi:hypothetical protein
MDNEYFTIADIVDHLTHQAIRADAQMQLQQTQLWQEQTEGKMLFDTESHLKFLGLEELKYSVKLKKKGVGIFQFLRKMLHLPDHMTRYRIHHNGSIALVVRISRNPQKKYVNDVEMDGEKISI